MTTRRRIKVALHCGLQYLSVTFLKKSVFLSIQMSASRFSPNEATQCSQHQPLVTQNYISNSLQQIQPVFTIKRMMYETETTSQQPINQLQTNDGHAGPKPYWPMTDAMWLDCGSREHNIHLIVAVLQRECTNLTTLILTNGQETAVMNAPGGGFCLNTNSWKVRNRLTDSANRPKQMEPSTHFCLIVSLPIPR